MGKNSASEAAAAQQRADEQARQERIRKGTASINKIFDGGTFGTGAIAAGAAYDPTKQYFLEDGSAWTPTVVGKDPNGAKLNKAFQDALGKGLYSGTETKEGFNDQFFDGLSKSYVDFARPQLDEQAAKARNQLTFALARNGTLDSSMRSTQNADLQRNVDKEIQSITDKGREYATEARTGVEQARADLIANLTMTGDNVGASNAALARAKTLAAPPAYSPLGQLFTDYTAGLAQQAAFERAAALGYGTPSRGGAGLFGTNKSAVKVT